MRTHQEIFDEIFSVYYPQLKEGLSEIIAATIRAEAIVEAARISAKAIGNQEAQ